MGNPRPLQADDLVSSHGASIVRLCQNAFCGTWEDATACASVQAWSKLECWQLAPSWFSAGSPKDVLLFLC